MPLAVVADIDTQSPNLYFVHADHLDRPVKMTDGNKTVVWDAVYNPFGEVNSITGSATNNLRFPGQYFLIESGLAYNWHRHYDPTIGRYLQPDPLGFVDGPSVYGYARSAPGMYIDPAGEFIPLIVAGAVVGAVINSGIYALSTPTYTWQGAVGAALAGGIAGGVGTIAAPLAGTIGIGGGLAGRSLVNALAGLAAGAVTGALDPCQDSTLGYLASSAAFGFLGGFAGSKLFPTIGMSRFGQVGFPRTGQVSFRKCLEELQVRMQETPFTRVGRCRSASVQWGLHMFNRNTSQEVAIPTLGGILAVAVAAYLAYSGNIPFERVIGFLAGLLGGFFSVLLGRFRVLTPSKLWLLRTPEILLSPIGVILFLPFSLRMAGGYFLGSSASFCFAWAVLALRTRESQGTS
jgi:RHS repeat-associated protein